MFRDVRIRQCSSLLTIEQINRLKIYLAAALHKRQWATATPSPREQRFRSIRYGATHATNVMSCGTVIVCLFELSAVNAA